VTKRLGLLVKVAVSVGLVVWLGRGLGLKAIGERIAEADPARLAAAAGFLAVSYFLASWQWGRLLHLAGAEMRPARILGYTWAAALGNLVLPTGAAGDLARVVGAGQESRRGPEVFAATLLDRLLGLALLGLFGVFGLLAVHWTGSGENSSARWVAFAVAGNATASLALLLLVLGPWGRWIVRRIANRLPLRSGAQFARLEAVLDRFRSPRALLPVVGISALIQSSRILAHAQVARALDIQVGLGYFFAFVPLLAVAVSLPVSIGGIGVRESMGAFLFGLLGVDPARGSAMQLLAYLVAIAVSLPGALLMIFAWRTSQMKAAEARAREAAG
jgi:glycosyltransferase 2 family protein